MIVDGRSTQLTRSLGLPDTPENRIHARQIADLVGASIRAGRSLAEIYSALGGRRRAREERLLPRPAGVLTVEKAYDRWLEDLPPNRRRSLEHDYKRHFRGYILGPLGQSELRAIGFNDIEGLQASLIARGLSVKTVKNIINGSLRAYWRWAFKRHLVTVGAADLFGALEWEKWQRPEPDPFTAGEMERIIDAFRTRLYRIHEGDRYVRRLFPIYHAYVHLLFWSGMRPSEVSGLWWTHIDLKLGTAIVRQSRARGAYAAPKTASSRRTVELHEDTVALLKALKPLKVRPETPVFHTIDGNPIEPGYFANAHWYDVLRALEIRERGLYATKDTFVSLAMTAAAPPRWIEAQTGVAWSTLTKHYGKWIGPGAGVMRAVDRFVRGEICDSTRKDGSHNG